MKNVYLPTCIVLLHPLSNRMIGDSLERHQTTEVHMLNAVVKGEIEMMAK